MLNEHDLLGALDHPAYHQQIKLRWYNGRINVFQAVTPTDAAKVLRRLKPTWTKDEHASLAQQHADAADQHERAWSQLVDQAAIETFGRPYHITDYRISGIACDEFSEPMKQALRFAAHARTYHRQLSGAHACASGQRRR
ncbi:hypothetical protein RQP54_18005 [Curvibacter sp. APW13]|uniref:hypothetical protein n=1 Tax=Curvibacter sp. APW13 TaxID=3077236 RepID=UPI0028E03862|nr:hypothetical protein [Curvibacter sp. APW13]MDT8992772.1 hypothetical protein [Curvibacter sp. APW13]